MKHSNIQKIIAKAARDVGLTTGLEHGGGLGDKRRPGDVIIYNWHENKHLLVDVAVTNPQRWTNLPKLISEGVGAAASEYEKVKWKTYPDLDFKNMSFFRSLSRQQEDLGKRHTGFAKSSKADVKA